MLEYIKLAIRELLDYAYALLCYAFMLAFSYGVFMAWFDYLAGVFK
ncbi:MAG: hypothetical protein IJP89_02195 [Synergistaceae bacterium]|nr:hypothetical protein [Synergistaceae bacterium]